MAAAGILALASPAAAMAQSISAPATAAQAESPDDIVVVGQNGDKTKLTADSLRDAAQAYVANRAEFAPDAPFQFEVRNADPAFTTGLKLYLRKRKPQRDGSYPTRDLAFDDQRRFELPTDLVVSGDWELRTTPNRAGLRISPAIFSPGTKIGDRRVGDFRLQCRVLIAFARISAPLRVLVSAFNLCNNKSVGWYEKSPKPLLRAEIPGRDIDLMSKKNPDNYRIPLGDKRIANDERLRLTYK